MEWNEGQDTEYQEFRINVRRLKKGSKKIEMDENAQHKFFLAFINNYATLHHFASLDNINRSHFPSQ